VERSEARRKILACLQAAAGAMTPKAIAEQAGLSRGFVRYLLHHMVRSGEIKGIERGWYTIPLSYPPPLTSLTNQTSLTTLTMA
jgi:predicted transcriptional regulator